MHGFTIIGEDRESGETVRMPVHLGSVGEAVEFGRSRGVEVREVQSGSGHTFRVTADGITKDPTNTPERQSDREAIVVIVSFAIPLVGLIAGSVRYGTGRKGGGLLIGAAVVGLVLWAVLLGSSIR